MRLLVFAVLGGESVYPCKSPRTDEGPSPSGKTDSSQTSVRRPAWFRADYSCRRCEIADEELSSFKTAITERKKLARVLGSVALHTFRRLSIQSVSGTRDNPGSIAELIVTGGE
jgi:hypothetical protein